MIELKLVHWQLNKEGRLCLKVLKSLLLSGTQMV